MKGRKTKRDHSINPKRKAYEWKASRNIDAGDEVTELLALVKEDASLL